MRSGIVRAGASFDILDRKSTRLNSSHLGISYAVFCLKKKKKHKSTSTQERNVKSPPAAHLGRSASGPATAHSLTGCGWRLARVFLFFFFFFLNKPPPPKFSLFPLPAPFRP